MEPVYSAWKPLFDAYNRKKLQRCPFCEENTAVMMTRYTTNRDGETEKQYRVECPVCKKTGKTYLHESVAYQSWVARENHPKPKPVYRKGRWYD